MKNSNNQPAPFFRYLAPLLPVFVILYGFVIEQTLAVMPAVALAPIVIFLFNQPLPDFFSEITHDYNGPMEGIVAFLRQNAAQGDTVVITNEDLPLKFYTNLRVVGGLTGENLTPYLSAKWVIIRK